MTDTGQHPSRVRQEFTVRGTQLVDKVRELIHAGNVRRVIVKRHGRVVVEFPVTVGVVGTLLAPQLAALGALATLLTESTIEIIRTTETPPSGPTTA